ncbi:MAG: STAS/SEC14 domain-containing protein [Alphaproteobacteria bacterium]
MMEIIEDLPDGVVGIATKGKITHEDYQNVVIPGIEKALETHDKVSVMFILEDLPGMEMAALWDDTKFGLQHWRDFKRMALVTDLDWVRNMTAFFAWMIPAEVKMFALDQEQEARNWVSGLS